jgi:hypothetical protein
MALDVRGPAAFARQVEQHPRLPAATCERVSGYGVMGLPFRSGHVLGLRRWTASSVGDGYTSIWHRDPAGRWTFYQSAPAEIACTRYFGADVARVQPGPIALDWDGERCLHVHTEDSPAVEWRIELGSSPVTRLMSLAGSALPLAAWRSRPVLSAMGRVAEQSLRVGTVKLTGKTPNGQPFDANPLRIWLVTDSHAVVEGEELGPIGPLAEQAHLADFYIPQRGIFAIGRFFARCVPGEVHAGASTTEVLR